MRMLFLLCGLSACLVLHQAKAQDPATAPNGNALLHAGKALQACEAFEAVLDRNPENPEAQAGEVAASEKLALQELATGHRDDALKVLLQAQEYVPENPKLLLDLGILEDQMGLYVDADKTLSHLERLTPEDAALLYALARVKLDLGQLELAEEKMKAYLKLKPDDASAHYGLGRVYRQGLQFDKARVEFQRSIELQPVQTEGYYELGDALLAMGNSTEALPMLQKTLERNPRHGGALTDEGVVYFKQKQYPKALHVLRSAIAAAPDYQQAHYYLGLTLARMGHQEESKRELEKATEMAERDRKQASGLRLHVQLP